MSTLHNESIFKIPNPLPKEFELFQPVISNENVQIERIVSSGQNTPNGQWLEDDRNEWVVLLQGESEISFEDGTNTILNSGDHILIEKHKKHRVVRTSENPFCIWLAVYFE